jgi:hypothetical protein
MLGAMYLQLRLKHRVVLITDLCHVIPGFKQEKGFRCDGARGPTLATRRMLSNSVSSSCLRRASRIRSNRAACRRMICGGGGVRICGRNEVLNWMRLLLPVLHLAHLLLLHHVPPLVGVLSVE